MSQINVKVRLRPTRFAFLVSPNDKAGLLEIFRVNTCLWGGKFNPIIPIFKRTPTWWNRDKQKETPQQIIYGYLDAFEPDFLVEAELGLANGLGYEPDRVLQLSTILPKNRDPEKEGTGLSVFDLYSDLYKTEFQFVRRFPHAIKYIKAKSKSSELFTACVFGSFPKDEKIAYFGKAFTDAFSPDEIDLDSNLITDLYKSRYFSPLDIGHENIEIEFDNTHDRAIYVMDFTSPADLIDYWNLRGLRGQLLAVPVQWLSELSTFCKELIQKNHKPMRGNPHGLMLHTTIHFGRSIPTLDIEDIYRKNFISDTPEANVRQDFYPAFWRRSSSYSPSLSRPTLDAGEESIDVPFEEGDTTIRFNSMHPKFAERYGGEFRWANVIKLASWESKHQLALALPTEHINAKISRYGGDQFISSTEGFILFPPFRDLQNYWEIKDGTSAISEWLKVRGITTMLSESGKTTQQIIQALGFRDMRSIAHPRVVKILNDIARRPTGKSMQHQQFLKTVDDCLKDDIWRGENAAEMLVKKKVVELGMELKCEKCASWSWYSVPQLDYQVNCALCLRSFSFPLIDPTNKNKAFWSYRLIGPFALPEFANGGYAASLAIRFFSLVLGQIDSANVSWSAGQQLSFANKSILEADFILWYQRTRIFGRNYPTEMVFGEAKSFGKAGSMKASAIAARQSNEDVFSPNDINRMKLLAEAFPGSILVFATMKEAADLSKAELKNLRKLAEWGREHNKFGRSRAPVIILTGTELFSSYSLQITWNKKEGRHKDLIAPGYIQTENLRTLADITQQLYLDMPSYFDWEQQRLKARFARRKIPR